MDLGLTVFVLAVLLLLALVAVVFGGVTVSLVEEALGAVVFFAAVTLAAATGSEVAIPRSLLAGESPFLPASFVVERVVGELEVSLAMLSPYLTDSAYSSLTSATVSRALSIPVNNGKISLSRTKPGRKIAKIGRSQPSVAEAGPSKEILGPR